MDAWITPDALPVPATVCRTITIRSELLSALNGALFELCDPGNWEQVGDMTPEECADAFTAAVDAYLDSRCDFMRVPVGTIVCNVNQVAVPNFVICDGSIYTREQYPELYDVIADVLKIDADTFRVPDLRNRFLLASSPGIGVTTTGGEATVTLTTPQLPAHNHSVANFVTASIQAGTGPPQSFSLQLGETDTGNAGNSQPHNNMPPYYVVRYIICVK